MRLTHSLIACLCMIFLCSNKTNTSINTNFKSQKFLEGYSLINAIEAGKNISNKWCTCDDASIYSYGNACYTGSQACIPNSCPPCPPGCCSPED